MPGHGEGSQPASASSPASKEAEGLTIDLGEADNGRSLTLKAGDTVTVTLPENASTGYVWELDPTGPAGSGPAELSLLDKTSTYPDAAIGGGGSVTFRFRAAVAGTATLTLINRRPWEDASSDAKRFVVQATISP